MPLSDCKKEAKLRLKSRKLRAFRITLCIGTAALLSAAASYLLPQAFTGGGRNAYMLLGAQIVLGLLSFGLLGTMRQGRAAWLYCCACGKEPSGVLFLYWLRKGRGFRAAFLHTVVSIRKAVWFILLSAPGIAVLVCAAVSSDLHDRIRTITWVGGLLCLAIGLFFAALINQKYALAPILLATSPEKGVRSAVRGSCFLMDDSCMKLFLLKLSFLPWTIPGLAVLPLVYIIPYYQQTTACMLRSILRAHTL